MENYLIIFVAAIVSAGPAILAKKYIDSSKQNKIYLWLAILLNAILIAFYINLSEKYGATIMYTIVKILSIVLVAVVGYIFLNEKLGTKQIIGILFAIAALYLLSSK